MPGVYVVKVTDEKTLQATALVVGSDLDAIVKVSREQVLVFAQDMKTGQGRKGARVLIADGAGVILEKTTGDDGVLLASWDKPLAGSAPNAPAMPAPRRPPTPALQYLVLDGGDAAGSILGVPDKVAQGLDPPGLHLHRSAGLPARPGGRAPGRGPRGQGRPVRQPGRRASYKLEVYDARGRRSCSRRSTTLSEFGTFHEAIRLDSGAPVGSYRVRLYKPGQGDFAGSSRSSRTSSRRSTSSSTCPGRSTTGARRSRPTSSPSTSTARRSRAGRSRWRLPDGRIVRGTTDASGKFHVEFATDGFAEEQALRMVARLPGDNVGAVAGVMLAIKGFRIDLAHDSRRLPRRRDLRPERHHPRRPGQADRPELRVVGPQAGQPGRPDHRARGLASTS